MEKVDSGTLWKYNIIHIFFLFILLNQYFYYNYREIKIKGEAEDDERLSDLLGKKNGKRMINHHFS